MKMINARSFFAILLTLILSSSASFVLAKERGSSNSLSEADQEFIKKAGQGGNTEVELGRLAAQKAQDPQVKNFAQHIVRDHSQANQKLSALAKKKGVSVPASLSEEGTQLKNTLSALTGAEFDKKYMSTMVDDHQKDIDEFQAESAQGQDSDIKNFASQALPTLKRHLDMAQSIAKTDKP
ncbi:MAG: DUF4142 domain-containing protein [Gammaproteobacteria bacterium]|nr:DUF4142 domain-containing protein [Gammaproteobacteria bacterium]